MCGIFGADNYPQFMKLLEINRKRGSDTFTMATFCSDKNKEAPGYHLDSCLSYSLKPEGIVDSDGYETTLANFADRTAWPDTLYFLGHVRTPTNSDHVDKEQPASHGINFVWHNGIIKNTGDEWDTQYLINKVTPGKVFSFDAFRDIVGSFACAFFINRRGVFLPPSKKISELFLVRNWLAPLYYTHEGRAFSSSKIPGGNSLKPHWVYSIDRDFTTIGEVAPNPVNNIYQIGN